MGTVVVRAMQAADGPAAFAARVASFSDGDPGAYDPSVDAVYAPMSRRLVAELDGEVVGHLAVWPRRQYLLGTPVACAGVAGVAVAPHARRLGIAAKLTTQAIHDARDRGEVVSALFPNTQGLYRRLGWENAGPWSVCEVAAQALGLLPPPRDDVTLARGSLADVAAMAEVEEAVAALHHGRMPRGVGRIMQLLDDGTGHAVLARRGRDLVGWVMWFQESSPDGARQGLVARVSELVATDHDAWLALWRVLASTASTVGIVRYVAPPVDPLMTVLGPQATERERAPWQWMTRILDLDGFLQARPWPGHVDVAVPLTVHDPVLGDRTGVLEVSGGSAAFTPGDAAGPSIDVGAFSSLAIGGFTARQLAWLGRLQGADDRHLDDLDEACRAPTPWTSDHF